MAKIKAGQVWINTEFSMRIRIDWITPGSPTIPTTCRNTNLKNKDVRVIPYQFILDHFILEE